MTGFVPPKPQPLSDKPGVIARIRGSMGSSLALFQPGSYTSLGVSRFSIPTAPRLVRRWLYTARDPALVRDMLVNRPADFPKSVMMGAMLKSLTGDSIFTTNGEVWQRQRRLIDPALEAARVKASFDSMRDAADAALIDLDQRRAQGPVVLADEAMTHFAADVIFRTIFSEPLQPRVAKKAFAAFETFQNLAYAHGMIRLSRLPTALFPGALPGVMAGARLRRLINQPLKRRLAEVKAGAPPRNDILGTLLATRDPDTGRGFTPRELLDQITMLFLAGHETSASAIAWALYLLAADPEVQDRVRAEVDAAAGDGPLEFHHLRRLAFTRDVFREGMRLYPPVAFVARDTTRAECLGDRKVEPGAVVFIAAWLLHRNAALWDQPDVFDPDRFARPETKEAARCAYMPFSMGPRVCPGAAFALQEGTLVLAMIVRRFRLGLADGPPPQPFAKLTLRSATGIRLTLQPVDTAQAGSTTTADP
jgi:cytochrome P450